MKKITVLLVILMFAVALSTFTIGSAAEFEGLEWLMRESENQGDKRFDGYTRLDMIQRAAPGVVLLKLTRGG